MDAVVSVSAKELAELRAAKVRLDELVKDLAVAGNGITGFIGAIGFSDLLEGKAVSPKVLYPRLVKVVGGFMMGGGEDYMKHATPEVIEAGKRIRSVVLAAGQTGENETLKNVPDGVTQP